MFFLGVKYEPLSDPPPPPLPPSLKFVSGAPGTIFNDNIFKYQTFKNTRELYILIKCCVNKFLMHLFYVLHQKTTTFACIAPENLYKGQSPGFTEISRFSSFPVFQSWKIWNTNSYISHLVRITDTWQYNTIKIEIEIYQRTQKWKKWIQVITWLGFFAFCRKWLDNQSEWSSSVCCFFCDLPRTLQQPDLRRTLGWAKSRD